MKNINCLSARILLRHTMDAYKDRLRAVEIVSLAEFCALKTRQAALHQFVPRVQFLAFDGDTYYAADNRDGEFESEEFDTFHKAMFWLLA
jgi:hypothetical protein